MKHVIIIGLVISQLTAYGQATCDCKSELDYVINYYEKNLPGFKDNVTPLNKNEYSEFKVQLKEAASNISKRTECFKILTRFVEFCKDNHSSIRMQFPSIDESDSIEVKTFKDSEIYISREIIDLADKNLGQHPINKIEGIYQTSDTTYTIAIIPDKSENRDYIGVILDSKSKLWERGQVKLELKKIPNSTKFEAFIYLRNHSIEYRDDVSLESGILAGNWFKTSLDSYFNPATDASTEFGFSKLNDSIAYLRIPTFSSYNSAKIDSLYKASFPEIRKTPYLIIDVRNNGGGNDNNAAPLLEFMYTDPIKSDVIDVYVTPDNIKVWESWYQSAKQDTVNFKKENLLRLEEEIERQKKAEPYTFISRSKGGEVIRNYDKNDVKKVVIIQNRLSASSCESLLFWAMQSSKTILVGENSGGYVGYGEIGSVPTPCYEFALGCTMTRYREQRKYEAEGIPPDYYLNYDEDWVKQAIRLLND